MKIKANRNVYLDRLCSFAYNDCEFGEKNGGLENVLKRKLISEEDEREPIPMNRAVTGMGMKTDDGGWCEFGIKFKKMREILNLIIAVLRPKFSNGSTNRKLSLVGRQAMSNNFMRNPPVKSCNKLPWGVGNRRRHSPRTFWLPKGRTDKCRRMREATR